MRLTRFIAVVTTGIIIGLTHSVVSPGSCETISAAIPPETIQFPEPRYGSDISVKMAVGVTCDPNSIAPP